MLSSNCPVIIKQMVSVNSHKIFFHCDIFKQNNYTVDSGKKQELLPFIFVYLLLNYFWHSISGHGGGLYLHKKL